MIERTIFHIDVNNAFLSWSTVDSFKHGNNIDYRETEAIVAFHEYNKGIVLARSIPCKKYGIKTADTVYSARRKCKSLIIVKPDYELYEKSSNDFYLKLLEYSTKVERYSVDECYMDVTGKFSSKQEYVEYAHIIKQDIYDTFGFTVNIGIGSNKLLAKMASDFEKPNKVHTLFIDEVEKKMHPLDISDLFMVGKKTYAKLKSMNINTISDLANSDDNVIIYNFGKMGEVLLNYSRGIDDSLVEKHVPKDKSISAETSLQINDLNRAKETLNRLSEEVGMRIRSEKMYANVIAVVIKDSNFNKKSMQTKLDVAISLDNEIYNEALKLYKRIGIDDTVRLIGIRLSNFTDKRNVQLNLFEDNTKLEDNEKLQNIIDDINKKYNKKVVTLASKM